MISRKVGQTCIITIPPKSLTTTVLQTTLHRPSMVKIMDILLVLLSGILAPSKEQWDNRSATTYQWDRQQMRIVQRRLHRDWYFPLIRHRWTSSSRKMAVLLILRSMVVGMYSVSTFFSVKLTQKTRDRNPPDGYRLSRIAFSADGQPTAASTSTSAAVNIMQNSNVGSCPGSCFRPTGLAWDSKDRLFMTSDTTNEIFVIGGAWMGKYFRSWWYREEFLRSSFLGWLRRNYRIYIWVLWYSQDA